MLLQRAIDFKVRSFGGENKSCSSCCTQTQGQSWRSVSVPGARPSCCVSTEGCWARSWAVRMAVLKRQHRTGTNNFSPFLQSCFLKSKELDLLRALRLFKELIFSFTSINIICVFIKAVNRKLETEASSKYLRLFLTTAAHFVRGVFQETIISFCVILLLFFLQE